MHCSKLRPILVLFRDPSAPPFHVSASAYCYY